MATTSQVPTFVRLGNMLTRTLLRAGFKVNGPKNVPMYMLTVRGRKSGQPRTTPIVVIEQDGKRYLVAPFGEVDWVRNLRAAGEATLTRGRRTEAVRAKELPRDEASLVLRRSLEHGRVPSFLAKYFEVTTQSSPAEFEEAAARHPVFLLQSPA
ncbi:MAG: nitroreductase family deazaflavin-dependent oxidoreductase [Ktedonobacterales bacterium]